jgi:tRNA U55 pseudouridine synthase TruB
MAEKLELVNFKQCRVSVYSVLRRDGTSVAHAHCQRAQYSRSLIRVQGRHLPVQSEVNTLRSRLESQCLHESEVTLFGMPQASYARNVFDTADLVREAIYQQLHFGLRFPCC